METTPVAQAYPIAPEPTAWEQVGFFVEYLWHYCYAHLTVTQVIVPFFMLSALLLAWRLSAVANVAPPTPDSENSDGPTNSSQT